MVYFIIVRCLDVWIVFKRFYEGRRYVYTYVCVRIRTYVVNSVFLVFYSRSGLDWEFFFIEL